MTSRGAISLDVVADTSKIAAQIQRELDAIIRKIKLKRVAVDGDTDPLERKVRKAAANADTTLSGAFDRIRVRAGAAGSGIGTALGVGIKAALTSAIGPAVSSAIALLTSIGPAVAAGVPAAIGVLGTLKVALFGVGDALKEIGDAEKFNEALKSLSPNAAKFAKSIKAILPDLTKLRLGVQDRFFLNLDKDTKAAAKSLTGPLTAGMNSTADRLNGIVRQFTAFAASSKGVAVVNTVFDVTSKVLAQISHLFGPLLDRVGDWIVKAGDSGVNSALLEAKDTLSSLVATAKNVAAAIGSVFGGLGKDGPTVAASLEKASKALRDFLASAQAQELLKTLGDAMDRVREIALKILETLPRLLPAVNGLASGGFGVLLTVVEGVVSALTAILGPLGENESLFVTVGQVIAVVVIAVKAYQAGLVLATAAQIAWGVATTVASAAVTAATAIYNTARVAVLLLSIGWASAGARVTLLTAALWAQVTAMASTIAGYVRAGAAAVVSGAQQAAALAVASAGWARLAIHQALASARLVAYTIATNAVKVATIAWTAVQWLLNAALTANPIGIIILLIVALVAGLVLAYKKSDTFRAIVDAAFRAVGAAALWLWENALKPLWDGIVWGFNMVVAGAKLWWSIVVAVFNAVVEAAVWLYTNWKKGFDLVVAAIVFVATKVGEFNSMVIGFFTGLVSAVGSKISALISFVTSIPGKILSSLGNLGNLLKEAGSNIIKGLIDGIDNMIGKLKEKVSGAVKAIRDYLPFSPAKVGPLSGSGSPERSGMRIVENIAHGIDRQRALLQRSMQAIASDLQVTPPGVSGGVKGGDGASAETPQPPGGLRVWPNQPATSTATELVITSDGTRYSQLLIEEIRKAVRVQGGDVQKVLGKSQGGAA